MIENYKFQKENIYFKYLDDDIDISITPSVIGYERCSPSKETIGPLVKSLYLIHYVISGKGLLRINDKEYEITQNGIFFIPPGVKISYQPDKSTPWQYLWVEFNGISAKALCNKALLCELDPVYYPKNNKAILKEFADMIEESIMSDSSITVSCLSHLLKIFTLLIKERQQTSRHLMSKAEYTIRPIAQYIEQNFYDSSLSLEIIAEHFHINASYLSRLFKKVMNIPPTKYIIELRMHKAFAMLKTQAFNITEISQTIGYSSPFYFSKEFKRYCGITPSEYQKSYLQREISIANE